MKVLINSTAILSLTLYITPPFAALAQDLPTAEINGGQVICLPDDQTACPDGAACVIAGAEDCQATAEETFSAAPEVAPAEEPAPEAAPEEAAPVEEAAPEEAAPEEVVPEEVAPEEAAPVEEAAPEEAAPEEVAPEEVAPEEVVPEEVAPEEAAPEEAAPEEVAPEEAAPAEEAAPLEEAAPEEAAPEEAAPEEAAPEEVAPEEVAPTEEPAPEVAPAEEPAAEATPEAAPEATTEAPVEATVVEPTAEEIAAQEAVDAEAIAAAQKAQEEAAAAALADPNLQPVEAPVVEEQAAEALTAVLDTPAPAEAGADATAETTAEPAAPAPAAATEAAIDPTVAPTEQPVPETATVTTETVTEADTRAADQEFAAAPVQVAPGKKSGLSDLEKAGLVALGALAIGTMLNSAQKGDGGQRQVVENTGDRVVVRQPDGSYVVYKDDNALLREPGSKVTTQTFQDGSTRTIVARADGSQIATIRDASGRVLQRVAYDRKGRATVLIDDLQPEEPIVISQLPKPKPQRIDVTDPDAAMRAALLAAQVDDYGAKFSLRQIRTIPEVRHLAPTIDVKEITFTSGSAALDANQAKSLNSLGRFIGQMIEENPGEVFLIEGHTDAVGSAASNLTLSDRRAETVAKALTQYFGVPPENMVVQGYGESELLIPSAGDERANRRVSVRIITPLLRQ